MGEDTMKKHVLMLTTYAFILACGATQAGAQESPGVHGHDGQAMMGQGGMMGCGIIGRGGMTGGGGMMGQGGMTGGGGMMGQGATMRFIFDLMDSDGDGTVSLQEFQAAHEKIFKAMDVDKDGTLTLEEMLAFMRGTSKSAPKEQGHD
jgi:hypothetical protein